MDIIKYITYANIYNSMCAGLYTTYTVLSYIPSYIPLLLTRKKGVSPEDISNTIDKLKNIQTNIKNRMKHIDDNIEEFLRKSKTYYSTGNKRSAIYNLKLKKMYEREKEKLDSINFNIETQIFSIESMDLIIVTAETLKDTSVHMKSMNTTLDIDKIESTMEELQDHRSINEELQNIFSESISLDFDDDELLEELETLNTEEVDTKVNVKTDAEKMTEEYNLLELKQKLPLPPITKNDNDKPSNPPNELIKEEIVQENKVNDINKVNEINNSAVKQVAMQ